MKIRITTDDVKLFLLLAAVIWLPVTVAVIMYELHIKRAYTWLYKRKFIVK